MQIRRQLLHAHETGEAASGADSQQQKRALAAAGGGGGPRSSPHPRRSAFTAASLLLLVVAAAAIIFLVSLRRRPLMLQEAALHAPRRTQQQRLSRPERGVEGSDEQAVALPGRDRHRRTSQSFGRQDEAFRPLQPQAHPTSNPQHPSSDGHVERDSSFPFVMAVHAPDADGSRNITDASRDRSCRRPEEEEDAGGFSWRRRWLETMQLLCAERTPGGDGHAATTASAATADARRNGMRQGGGVPAPLLWTMQCLDTVLRLRRADIADAMTSRSSFRLMLEKAEKEQRAAALSEIADASLVDGSRDTAAAPCARRDGFASTVRRRGDEHLDGSPFPAFPTGSPPAAAAAAAGDAAGTPSSVRWHVAVLGDVGPLRPEAAAKAASFASPTTAPALGRVKLHSAALLQQFLSSALDAVYAGGRPADDGDHGDGDGGGGVAGVFDPAADVKLTQVPFPPLPDADDAAAGSGKQAAETRLPPADEGTQPAADMVKGAHACRQFYSLATLFINASSSTTSDLPPPAGFVMFVPLGVVQALMHATRSNRSPANSGFFPSPGRSAWCDCRQLLEQNDAEGYVTRGAPPQHMSNASHRSIRGHDDAAATGEVAGSRLRPAAVQRVDVALAVLLTPNGASMHAVLAAEQWLRTTTVAAHQGGMPGGGTAPLRGVDASARAVALAVQRVLVHRPEEQAVLPVRGDGATVVTPDEMNELAVEAVLALLGDSPAWMGASSASSPFSGTGDAGSAPRLTACRNETRAQLSETSKPEALSGKKSSIGELADDAKRSQRQHQHRRWPTTARVSLLSYEDASLTLDIRRLYERTLLDPDVVQITLTTGLPTTGNRQHHAQPWWEWRLPFSVANTTGDEGLQLFMTSPAVVDNGTQMIPQESQDREARKEEEEEGTHFETVHELPPLQGLMVNESAMAELRNGSSWNTSSAGLRLLNLSSHTRPSNVSAKQWAKALKQQRVLGNRSQVRLGWYSENDAWMHPVPLSVFAATKQMRHGDTTLGERAGLPTSAGATHHPKSDRRNDDQKGDGDGDVAPSSASFLYVHYPWVLDNLYHQHNDNILPLLLLILQVEGLAPLPRTSSAMRRNTSHRDGGGGTNRAIDDDGTISDNEEAEEEEEEEETEGEDDLIARLAQHLSGTRHRRMLLLLPSRRRQKALPSFLEIAQALFGDIVWMGVNGLPDGSPGHDTARKKQALNKPGNSNSSVWLRRTGFSLSSMVRVVATAALPISKKDGDAAAVKGNVSSRPAGLMEVGGFVKLQPPRRGGGALGPTRLTIAWGRPPRPFAKEARHAVAYAVPWSLPRLLHLLLRIETNSTAANDGGGGAAMAKPSTQLPSAKRGRAMVQQQQPNWLEARPMQRANAMPASAPTVATAAAAAGGDAATDMSSRALHPGAAGSPAALPPIRVVFLHRGSRGQRLLLNDGALLALMLSMRHPDRNPIGRRIDIVPCCDLVENGAASGGYSMPAGVSSSSSSSSAMPYRDQASLVASADILMGVHGAGLLHVLNSRGCGTRSNASTGRKGWRSGKRHASERDDGEAEKVTNATAAGDAATAAACDLKKKKTMSPAQLPHSPLLVHIGSKRLNYHEQTVIERLALLCSATIGHLPREHHLPRDGRTAGSGVGRRRSSSSSGGGVRYLSTRSAVEVGDGASWQQSFRLAEDELLALWVHVLVRYASGV